MLSHELPYATLFPFVGGLDTSTLATVDFSTC